MEMKLLRTVHPIGQGTFISERFIGADETDLAVVVYDCGSNNTTILKREISSSFGNIKEIDILFISHFDSDHVNGVRELLKNTKIKTVVVPLIDKKNRWFYLYQLGNERDVLLNPLDYFKAEKIIEVRPVSTNDVPTSNPNQRQESLRIDGIPPGNHTYSSGTAFSLNGLPRWSYRPYNFDESTRIAALESVLQNLKIDKKCLNDPAYIEGHYRKINDAYKKVCSDGANKSSLIVYSGPLYWECSIKTYMGCACTDCCTKAKHSSMDTFLTTDLLPQTICEKRIRAACLYLGDTDLNQMNSTTKMDILTDLCQYLSGVKDNIGTIQLPHHGARRNYNQKLPSSFPNAKIYFVSFGSSNIYGHPSNAIIGQLLAQGLQVVRVCNQRQTAFIEIIY
ncbi:MAG: MBL fold metallo-hydrolase [Muribaculaceae bacterium]|nr:MBL fold metallo-hydrolase [Muribaculaceae bacterium]